MQTDFVVRNLCFFTCINTIAQEPYVLYNYGTDKNIHDEMAHLSKVITVLLASSFESLIQVLKETEWNQLLSMLPQSVQSDYNEIERV